MVVRFLIACKFLAVSFVFPTLHCSQISTWLMDLRKINSSKFVKHFYDIFCILNKYCPFLAIITIFSYTKGI